MAKHITMIRNCAVEQNLDGVRRLKIWECAKAYALANLWFFGAKLWWYKGTLSPFEFQWSLHMTYNKFSFLQGIYISFAQYFFGFWLDIGICMVKAVKKPVDRCYLLPIHCSSTRLIFHQNLKSSPRANGQLRIAHIW